MNSSKPKAAPRWPAHPLSHYPEPPWTSHRPFDVERFPHDKIHDPCAGLGNILKSARAAGLHATGADIAPRDGRKPVDFLKQTRIIWAAVVFNPPTQIDGNDVLAQFVEHAFAHSQYKTAFFTGTQRLHAAHWRWKLRSRRIWLLNPRPSCPSVDYILDGYKPEGGSQNSCWVGLEHGHWKSECAVAQLLRDVE